MTLENQARQQMITQQLRCWSVLDERVLTTMMNTPRELFVPPAYRDLAFADTSIPLSDGQSTLAPKVEGRLLQALNIQPSDVVLVVGANDGYLLACAARLARQVHCIEADGTIAAKARQDLLAATINNVSIDARGGAQPDEQNAYDAILITGSLPLYDQRYERLLKQGGRLVVVTGESPVMQVLRITRTGNVQWQREVLFETDIPALPTATKPTAFVF